MRMHYIQHVPFETPGNIELYFKEKQHQVTGTHLYNGCSLPTLEAFDCLLVMGGPMNVEDVMRYPWLVEEKQLIHASIKAGKKLIGICLGAQLIAEAFGGKVYPGPYKEIGWLPIQKPKKLEASGTSIDSLMAFHWHGDTFDLPVEAELLYVSATGIKQVYTIGHNVLGLQCHFEMTDQGVKALVANAQSDLAEEGPYIQSGEEILAMKDYFAHNKTFLYELLDDFISS